MKKVEQIAEIDPEAIIADGYDDAIIGLSWDSKVVYDGNKCVEILMKEIIKEKMQEEEAEEEVAEEEAYQEALEFLEYNTFCAYVGDRTPIFIFPCEEEGEESERERE